MFPTSYFNTCSACGENLLKPDYMLTPPKTNQNRIHIAPAQKRVDKTLSQKHGLCVQEVTTLYRKARLKKLLTACPYNE